MLAKNPITLACYGVSFVVYTVILLLGLFGNHYGTYFGYAIFSFYFAIPMLSFAMSLVLSLNNAELKWIYPFLFGILGASISAIVSWMRLSSLVIFSDVWLFCVVPPFVALGMGYLIRVVRIKRISKRLDL